MKKIKLPKLWKLLKKQVGIDLENCVYLWKFLAKSLEGFKEDK